MNGAGLGVQVLLRSSQPRQARRSVNGAIVGIFRGASDEVRGACATP